MLVTDAIGLVSALNEREKSVHEREQAGREAMTKAWAEFAVDLITHQTKTMIQVLARRG